MKLSHKIALVSAAALMFAGPLTETASNPSVVQAKSHKRSRRHARRRTRRTRRAKKTRRARKSRRSRRSGKKSRSLAGKIVLSHNSYIYFANGKRNRHYDSPHAMIGKGVVLNYTGTKTINGVLYFGIGGNNYIKAANVATKDGKKYSYKPAAVVLTPSVKLNHNAYEYSKTGKAQYKKGKHLKIAKGKTVRAQSLHYIGDVLYYNLGGGHYIKAANADQVAGKTLTPDNQKANNAGKGNQQPSVKQPFSVTLRSASGALNSDGSAFTGTISTSGSYSVKNSRYFGQNLYYQLDSNKAWLPASDVASKTGDEPTPANAPYTPASSILKSTLQNEVNSWDTTTFRNSLQYKLASKTERDAFDQAAATAKSLLSNQYAALNEVNDAARALDAAHSNLNGHKVKVHNLNSLTPAEQTAVLNAVAQANGLNASDLRFSGNNSTITYTNSNGYTSTFNLSDYAEQ